MPIRRNKISYTLELSEMMDDLNIKPSERKTAAEAVGQFLLEQMSIEVGQQRTPVQDGSYKRGLSKEYKKFKQKKGKGGIADLHFSGDMFNNLNIKPTKEKVTLSITDTDQRAKAFNHNSPKSSSAPLPQRQFLPDDSSEQVFKNKITKRITGILESFSQEDDGESNDKEL